MSDRLNVLLVDDHVLFRKGVASLLGSRPDMEVVAEAGNGLEAIEKAREIVPDLILMDVHMPVCDGLEAVRVISREMPNAKIVMLSVDEDDATLFEAIKCGAQGYLLKKLTPDHLFRMLDTVIKGEVALPPLMMAKVLAEFQHPSQDSGGDRPGPVEELSDREIEVLEHIVTGASNADIAAALVITENTVKNHLRNILAKLHLQNRVQAAVYAVRTGLVDDPTRRI